MSNENIQAAAERLLQAANEGAPCRPVRDLLGDDVNAAYGVQQLITRQSVNAGQRIVGRKIGLTSPKVQAQLGVNQPDFGVLFADMLVGEGIPVQPGRVLQPKIEAEIAIVLAQDLDMEHVTLVDVLCATRYVLPALEIVGSRILDWDIGIVDTVADNASSGLFVLGGPARSPVDIDFRNATMSLRKGGEVVSEGTGAACLGHPLNAAVWLANELQRREDSLRAGDIVLTGALGPMVPVTPGDSFDAQIDGVGHVSISFAR